MWHQLKLYLKNFDWVMLVAVLLLIVFGLVEIYSVALGQGSLNLQNFYKQLVFAGIGLLALLVFSFVDYGFLRSFQRYLYLLAGLLLLGVLIFGETIRGTKGWFSVFGFNLQPVEFVKIVLIIFLAKFFSNHATKVKTMRHFLFSAAGTGLLVFLVLMQPDFGSALMLGAIWLVMIIAAGFKRKFFLMIFLTGAVAFAVSWTFLFKDYQRERVLNLFNPSANAQASGYNISQAIIAIGSGGATGKGVGFGSQSQLKFLPEAQTDFIFAVIAEELGFLGVLLILGFYSIFFFRCLQALKKVGNDFGIYFIIGSAGLIFIQMFINIGMNLGVLPVVGLPLPFVSYGGSSLISLLILVGITQNIIIKSRIRY